MSRQLACHVAAWALAAVFVPIAALAATPTSYLEESAIVGVGQTITVTRLPVLGANGGLIYKNVTIALTIGTAGQITYAAAEPVVTASPSPVVSSIQAGIYGDSANTAVGFAIAGPGIGSGGNSVYTVTRSGPYCAVAQPGVFYAGPISTTPIAARVRAAGINTGQYRVGIVGQEACGLSFNYANFPSQGLFGLSQVGNTLVVSSFTDSTGKDHPTPVNQVNYVLVQ